MHCSLKVLNKADRVVRETFSVLAFVGILSTKLGHHDAAVYVIENATLGVLCAVLVAQLWEG